MAANFARITGAHAATSSAICAAKMSVLAKATKMRRILARDVIFAAWCTRNAAVTSSEMAVEKDDGWNGTGWGIAASDAQSRAATVRTSTLGY